MTRAPVVVDTNVLVAGLLTADPAAPTAAVVNGILEAAFPFVISDRLLAEYAAVLHRKEIRRLHELSDEELDAILVDVAQNAIVMSPAAGQPAPDEGDQHLWDLLHERGDLVLITGDKALLRARQFHGRIITPRQFVEAH